MANLWISNQFHKGNNSCITDASVIKLNKHSCVTTNLLDIIVLKSMKFHYIVA